MYLVSNSFTIVLLGDWNSLYIQPDWVANNVYENPEIEIGINGQGVEFSITYKKDKVVISPSQSKMVFSVTDIEEDAIKQLCRCICNYLEKAYTPQINAYGLNVDYYDNENTQLASIFDEMRDVNSIINMGYTISETKISRKIEKSGNVINMDCSINKSQTIIHFNEHHGSPEKRSIDFSSESIQQFFARTTEIIKGLGYEIE